MKKTIILLINRIIEKLEKKKLEKGREKPKLRLKHTIISRSFEKDFPIWDEALFNGAPKIYVD